MEGVLPLSIFFLCLFLFLSFNYRLPGALSFLFLFLSSLSIYSIFLLSGLTFNRSTLIALVSLIFLGSLNSLNFLKKIKKFLLLSHYTTKMAIHLARKQHNFFIYELGLILLIPSSISIFFLPLSLKELGIVLILGSFILSILWLFFSNFYLPKIITLLEDKNSLLVAQLSSREKFKQAKSEFTKLVEDFRESALKLHPKKQKIAKKLPFAPTDFAPIVFILGFIGLIFWMINYELNYPDFFKSNKLLSIDSNSNREFKTQLSSLSRKYKELNTPPEKVSLDSKSSNSLAYYLFPGGTDLNTLIERLKKPNNGANKNSDWTIQDTDAFSIMPSLQKTTLSIFISLVPILLYSFFRFGLAIALSVILAFLFYFGSSFMILYASSLEMTTLLPELLFASFFVLLSVANYAIINSKGILKQQEEEPKNKKLWFMQQARTLKEFLRVDSKFFIWSLITMLSLWPLFRKSELVYATLFFLVFVFFISLFFVPVLTSLWSKLSLLVDRIYFYMVRFFVKESSKTGENTTEEENVLGINY